MAMKKNAVRILAAFLVMTVSATILVACKKAQAAGGKGKTPSTAVTQQEKQALQSLVDDGTINKSQEDDIVKALSNMSGLFGGQGGASGAGSRARGTMSGFAGGNVSRPAGGSFSRPEGGSFSRPAGGSFSRSAGGSFSRSAGGSYSRPAGFASGASGSFSRPEGGAGMMANFNPLSALVEEGILTQEQADAVMQKVFASRFGAGQSGPSGASGTAQSGTASK